MNVSSTAIEKYNKMYMHYEVIARDCYSSRRNMAHALSDDFFPHIISALIAFGMQYQMGPGTEQKYNKNLNGFASRLSNALKVNSAAFLELELLSIESIDFAQFEDSIKTLYTALAINANLDDNGNDFHVGTTKVLHFIHPALFPIIDSKSSQVLRDEFGVVYRKSTQPGYSDERFIDSMKAIKDLVNLHGTQSIQALEPYSPITRIFDKLAFVNGEG